MSLLCTAGCDVCFAAPPECVATKAAVGAQHAEKKRVQRDSHYQPCQYSTSGSLATPFLCWPPGNPSTLHALLESGLCRSPGISLGGRCVTYCHTVTHCDYALLTLVTEHQEGVAGTPPSLGTAQESSKAKAWSNVAATWRSQWTKEGIARSTQAIAVPGLVHLLAFFIGEQLPWSCSPWSCSGKLTLACQIRCSKDINTPRLPHSSTLPYWEAPLDT